MIQERNWKKYGLSINPETIYMRFDDGFLSRIAQPHIDFVYFCHCAVADYLDAHPKKVKGYRYFDVLKIAAPKWYAILDNPYPQTLQKEDDVKAK